MMCVEDCAIERFRNGCHWRINGWNVIHTKLSVEEEDGEQIPSYQKH